MREGWINRYWKAQNSEKAFGGVASTPTPQPPFIRPRGNRAKTSTTSMNSHPKHTEIHRKSIFFTYFIDQKAKHGDIYCLQNSVFYFSYNVSTVACNAIPTRLRNRGGEGSRPLKSMILSRFWDFFGNRNGLRILGNSWEWNGVLLDPGNSRRFPGTGASIFKGRYYRNV